VTRALSPGLRSPLRLPGRGSLDPRGRAIVAATALLALVLGLVAGGRPPLAIAGALGAACVALMLISLSAGVVLFTVVMFFPLLGGSISAAKATGLLLALSWLATVVLKRAQPSLVVSRPRFAAALLLFVAWAALGITWAKRPDLVAGAVFTLILNSSLFAIVFAAVREPRHARHVCGAFVAGALLTALYGLLTGAAAASSDEGRLASAGLNPNQLGGYLAVAAILAATLACDRRLTAAGRMAWAGAAVLCLPLQLLTGSRGALLGLAAALLAAPFLVRRGSRAAVSALVTLAVGLGAASFATVVPDAIVQRTTSVQGGSGRTDIWRMGLRIVQAHPLTGVGAGNFSVSTIDYLLRPGATQRAIYIVDEPKVAHNIYLEVLAEFGAPGLVLFAAIVTGGLLACAAAVRAAVRRRERETELLSRGLLLALIAMLVAAFFSSELFSKQLWMLLALAVAVRSFAEEGRRA
jgi:O-antigen ligase